MNLAYAKPLLTLYNARGDVTRDTRGATAYNYAVNNAGRIRTLTIGTTLRATWTYDGFQKLRIKAATSPAATTHYIWGEERSAQRTN